MASAKGQRNAAIWNANYLGDREKSWNDTIDTASGMAEGAYGSGLASGLGALGTAYQTGSDAINKGIQGFDPWVQSGKAANSMYGNAIGLNGAEGNAAATGAFQASPGYQWQVDQATDAAARKAASLGTAASGNTLTALSTLGSNLANQEYGSWLDRLNGVSTQGLTAAGQQQAGYGNLANLAGSYGTSQANLYNNNASNLANLYTNTAQQKVNVGQNVANQITQGVTGAGQAGDAAKTANQNLALGIAGQGLKLLTTPISGSSILGGLGGMF